MSKSKPISNTDMLVRDLINDGKLTVGLDECRSLFYDNLPLHGYMTELGYKTRSSLVKETNVNMVIARGLPDNTLYRTEVHTNLSHYPVLYKYVLEDGDEYYDTE